MKVLIVAGSYPPMKCSVGDYSCNLAKALAARSVAHVSVLTSVAGAQSEMAGGVEIFSIVERWSLFEASKVIKTIRRTSPDIVHIQHPTQGYGNGLLPWFLPMISFMMGKKVVQTWHEGYSRRHAPHLFLKAVIPSKIVVVRPQYGEKILHPLLQWALWGKGILYIRNASCVPHIEMSGDKRDELKKRYLKGQKRLIVFFGFVYPHKGVELLFDIADSAIDHIVIAGEFDKKGEYLRKLMARVSIEPWAGKVTLTGFLSETDAAALLAVSDAVVLPFRDGGGGWNSSIHGAVLNGAFVITTSTTQNGYDKKRNVYFANIDDICEMKSALTRYAGTHRGYDADIDKDEWREIADEHRYLYENILGRAKKL